MLGFFILTAYVLAIITLAEMLRRYAGWQTHNTRKVIHIGVGMMSWLLPFIFETATPFLLGCVAFGIITFLDNRLRLIKAMQSKDDSSNMGTFYFPLAAGVVAWLFWDTPAIMVAALMPLTWGDGMAEVIGRAYGRHTYTVRAHTRSLEGTAAFILFGTFFTWLALVLLPFPAIVETQDFASLLLPALITVTLASIAEAISIAGLDNLTITAVSAIILSLYPF